MQGRVLSFFTYRKFFEKFIQSRMTKAVPNTNQIFSASNPKIEVIGVIGGLIGNGALELQTRLYRCLDEGRCYQVIDLDHVNQIDGLGVEVLENCMSRGLQIRLINVKPEILGIIRMAKKESLLNIIYNEKDYARAASLLEKDISEKKVLPKEGLLKKREHRRVKTSFPSEFKYFVNGVAALCSANILNLSEGGVLASLIVAVNENTREAVEWQVISEREIYDLRFKLNGDETSITTRGRCVREFISGESLCAGIHFDDIDHHQRERIRNFVDTHSAAKPVRTI